MTVFAHLLANKVSGLLSLSEQSERSFIYSMIGVFDSGYGGLTILKEIRKVLPEYDYLYLGDNARAPYGTRSFDCIYRYTLEAVQYMFSQGCSLVILACNTASAKALRTIQQHDLPLINSQKSKVESQKSIVNVLGVIRPTVEVVPSLTQTKHVGVLATPGTVASDSYRIELLKQDADLVVTQQACPMWVPLIEAGEQNCEGANCFIRKYIDQIMQRDPLIDTLLLGCTHYPLIQAAIDAELANLGHSCKTIAQGDIVAQSLADYLSRHPEYDRQLSRGGSCRYLTTDDAQRFAEAATLFLGQSIEASHVEY